MSKMDLDYEFIYLFKVYVSCKTMEQSITFMQWCKRVASSENYSYFNKLINGELNET